jgi:hypothetical protein
MRTHALLAAAAITFVATSPIQSDIFKHSSSKKLIELDENTSKWMSESEIYSLMKNNVHFMDITDFQDLNALGAPMSSVGNINSKV